MCEDMDGVIAPEEDVSTTCCVFCGEPMFIDNNGVSYHGTPDDIEFELDAEHVAVEDR